MTLLANSFVSASNPQFLLLSGSPLEPACQCLVNISPSKLSLNPIRQRKVKLSSCKRSQTIQASGDAGRSSSPSMFIGGFVLGGIIVGTLGSVYAPQISKVLAGADRKDLMRKLPKFIYDEEKALEKTRRILSEKIAQLNSAIDKVSAQLRTDDAPNGVTLSSDEIEATTST
ncbi:hypothetical protein BVC80_9085g60 [Macleaya cordata]|uniref:Inner membrane localized protein n=1 Tax=Macleaya cordata TaxID=56857 RepID=A0A200PR09_MACCD|nr:hypothetical protein BVC80_9085g60 [Macleaya cordata]